MRTQAEIKAWFDLPNDPDKASFEIKHLRAGETSAIVNATYKQRFEFRKPVQEGQEETELEIEPILITETDNEEEKVLTLIACIPAWINVFDSEGNELPCTAENVRKLCFDLSNNDMMIFVKFVQKCRKDLAKIAIAEQEQKRKNS